jgi:hypothetical protein
VTNSIQYGLIRLSIWTLEACGARVDLCNTTDTDATDPPAVVEAWGRALYVFCMMGELIGFSQRAMAEAGVCRRGEWDRATDTLARMGVLVQLPRGGTGYGIRDNGGAWHYRAVRIAIKRGEWPLDSYLPRSRQRPYPLLPPPFLRTDRAATQITQPAPVTQ